MSTENEVTTIHLNDNLTVFDVWQILLKRKHPEIVKQAVVLYESAPHGQSVTKRTEILPRERIVWDLNGGEEAFYGEPGLQKAIGAQVEVNYCLDPNLVSPEASRWFNDGETLVIKPDKEKSFIFVDIESGPNSYSLDLLVRALKNWKIDWYILNSGNGLHLIIDHLVPSKNLPKFYGQLIMDVAWELGSPKSMLYGHIGKYLIENCGNDKKLMVWTNDILSTVGHVDDSITQGKYVFPIDLRYIAHSIDDITRGQAELVCLRVSSKHGFIPTLLASQINRSVTIFEYEQDPFRGKQPSLPIL